MFQELGEVHYKVVHTCVLYLSLAESVLLFCINVVFVGHFLFRYFELFFPVFFSLYIPNWLDVKC